VLAYFKNKRIGRYTESAGEYVREKYIKPKEYPDHIRCMARELREDDTPPAQPKNANDRFDAAAIAREMRDFYIFGDSEKVLRFLMLNTDRTFVDVLLFYIDKKGLRDPDVYKAAGVDKRLFSKIASNRHYKPSKDTAVALAFALRLSPLQAKDLLSRAGYTLSRSIRRDVIIEFFFDEGIYDLADINDVLYRLGESPVGHF